jgi:hypothetical protein
VLFGWRGLGAQEPGRAFTNSNCSATARCTCRTIRCSAAFTHIRSSFRLFQPDDRKPAAVSYLIFGNDFEAFMAHYLGSYPDFDQVVALIGDTQKLRLNDEAAAALITIPDRENKKEVRLLKNDGMVAARVNGAGDELKIGVKAQIHYEPNLEIQR